MPQLWGSSEEKPERLGRGTCGELAKGSEEGLGGIVGLLAESVQDRHQHFAGMCSVLRLRPEADLAGDHQWSQFSFSQVVLGRDGRIVRQ